MADKKIFIDTNILIYAKSETSKFHEATIQKLDQLFEADYEFWISRQVIREYLVCITREESLKDIISAKSIQNDIWEFEKNFQIANETQEVTSNLINFYNDIMITGKQIHDANIVATMLANQIHQLLTLNVNDFKRFSKYISIK